jgi:hypothetical protein
MSIWDLFVIAPYLVAFLRVGLGALLVWTAWDLIRTARQS